MPATQKGSCFALLLLTFAAAACGSDTAGENDAGLADTNPDGSSDAVSDAVDDVGTSDTTNDATTSPDDRSDDRPDAPDDSSTAEPRDCAVNNGECGPSELAACVDGECVSRTDELRDILLDGIESLDTMGALPSALVVHGLNATPIVVDGGGRPVVAAAVVGEGRVVAVSHEGVLGHSVESGSGFGRLVQNAAAWLDNSLGAGTVGLWSSMASVGPTLQAAGWTAVPANLDSLDAIDVLVLTSYESFNPTELATLQTWVEGGGGVLIGGHAWWWGYENVDAPLNYPGNQTLGPAGITVTVQTANDGVYPLPERRATDLHHATRAIEALAAYIDDESSLTSAQVSTAAAAAGVGIDALPLEWDFFDEAAVLDEAVGPVVPTSADPVDVADEPIVALAARLQVRRALDAPVTDVVEHPAGADFPGGVAAEAARVSVTVRVQGTQDETPWQFAYGNPGADVWTSTGHYAAAGDEIVVTVPENVVDTGVAVQIGAHTDELYGATSWSRMPRVVRKQYINSPTTRIASGFGGPIYITVPPGARLGAFDVQIDGGVVMPLFDSTAGGLDGWTQTRAGAAPWAELAGEHFVLTVPSADIADLEAPDTLMALWDDILDADADLAGVSRDRPRAERFVVDRQISAGWMHSGYPMMAHVESAQEVLDRAGLLSRGAWGPLHELGHNHQNTDWVLPGTTESSVNLWSVYVSEEILGIERGVAHEAISPSQRAARVNAWRTGTDRDWSVWMALETYLQLQEQFGWEFYRTVFANYMRLGAGEHPADDAARLQLWIVMSSEAAGWDLTAFYDAWGLVADAATRDVVSRLPLWEEHPMR